MTQIPLDKLESILDRSSELEKSLSSELSSEDYVKFSKEYSEIEPLKNAIVDWKKFQAESEELNDIINDDSSDHEMLDLAKTELEEIVENMEDSNLSLDDSLKEFERGIELVKTAQKILLQAEQKVALLVEGVNGEPEKREMPLQEDIMEGE